MGEEEESTAAQWSWQTLCCFVVLGILLLVEISALFLLVFLFQEDEAITR